MKLDDYSEFNNEKPDEDYDEPSRGVYGSRQSSASTRAILALIAFCVIGLTAYAVAFSFRRDSSLDENLSSLSVKPISVTERDTLEPEKKESEDSSLQSESQETEPVKQREMEFLPDNSKVTAKDVVNLRSMPSTEDENCVILGRLANGDVLKRTGINYEMGWSRLDFGGQTVYAVTSYLEIVK